MISLSQRHNKNILSYTPINNLQLSIERTQVQQAHPENTIILFVCPPKFCKALFPVSLGNYNGPKRKQKQCLCKIWGDKQRVLWFSIITQLIIEILALSLAENSVIFRYNHLRRGDYSGRTNFQNTASRFVDMSEEYINLMKENAIPRNTKHATKFGMTHFKGKM